MRIGQDFAPDVSKDKASTAGRDDFVASLQVPENH
jgi:hypothetical protein